MFSKGLSGEKVIIKLDIDFDEVIQYKRELIILKGMDSVSSFIIENLYLLPFLEKICENIKSNNLTKLNIDFLMNSLCDYKFLADKKDSLQHDHNILVVKFNSFVEPIGFHKLPLTDFNTRRFPI